MRADPVVIGGLPRADLAGPTGYPAADRGRAASLPRVTRRPRRQPHRRNREARRRAACPLLRLRPRDHRYRRVRPLPGQRPAAVFLRRADPGRPRALMVPQGAITGRRAGMNRGPASRFPDPAPMARGWGHIPRRVEDTVREQAVMVVPWVDMVPVRAHTAPRAAGTPLPEAGMVREREVTVPREAGTVREGSATVPREAGMVRERVATVPRAAGTVPRARGMVPDRAVTGPLTGRNLSRARVVSTR